VSRRKRKHQDEGDKAEIDLTPMLDVVFIMLIFFIVTASFVKESTLNVNVPETKPFWFRWMHKTKCSSMAVEWIYVLCGRSLRRKLRLTQVVELW
jgi:hypothetical protein